MPLPLPHLSPQVFAILSALIEERAGIHYTLGDLELLREKAGTRALEAGFESLLDYYYFLRYDAGSAAELERLVDALVVGETYFFREFEQQRVLVDHLIPERLAKTGKATLRLWSAACATGEEPLTLAMLLEAAGLRERVELVASDISPRALERARAGRYGRRSVRNVPDRALLDRYLKESGDELRFSPEVISSIDWRRVNLVDAAEVSAMGRFDFIVCRNVLIYFRDEVARKVVAQLHDALLPGGALLVSVSESLLRFGTSLNVEEHAGVFVYTRQNERTGGGA